MSHQWTVEYVELDDKKPFEDFIIGLLVRERAKIFETIDYFVQLKNANLPIKESLSKHLEDGIFELRISLRTKIARSLYFCQKGARIIITHGFVKKTQKSPRKEIEKSQNFAATNFENLFQEHMQDPEFAKAYREARLERMLNEFLENLKDKISTNQPKEDLLNTIISMQKQLNSQVDP